MKFVSVLFTLILALGGFGLGTAARAGSLPDCRKLWKAGEHRYVSPENYADFQKRIRRENCQKDWTILVYMAADNDLASFALWDLYEMEAAFKDSDSAGSTAKTDLLVQVDGPKSDDLRRLHIFSGTEIYSPKQKEDFDDKSLDDVKSPVIARLPESTKETEQARLEEFLLWGAEKYPAKNFMVIVWGHGQGWKAYPVIKPAAPRVLDKNTLPEIFPSSSEPDAGFGGIAFKQSTGSWLDIPALRGALSTFRAVTGKPVDVYASDSCLMQMIEVAYELSSEARFVVGSTQVQNFLGLPYRRILYELNRGSFNGQRKDNRPNVNVSDEPYLLSKMIPGLMRQSLDPRRGLQGKANKEAQKFMTASALTSEETVHLLIPALANLSKALKSYLDEDPFRAMDLQFVTQNVPNFEGGAQDMGIFLGYLDLLLQEEAAKNGGLSPAAEKLQAAVAKAKAALDRAVLSYAYGTAYGVDEDKQMVGFVPRALSLWLPVDPREYASRRSEFQSSQFYRATQWQLWLDAVFPR